MGDQQHTGTDALDCLICSSAASDTTLLCHKAGRTVLMLMLCESSIHIRRLSGVIIYRQQYVAVRHIPLLVLLQLFEAPDKLALCEVLLC